MKVKGMEKVEGVVLISVVGLHFLQEYLSIQGHCIPNADPIFFFFFAEGFFCLQSLCSYSCAALSRESEPIAGSTEHLEKAAAAFCRLQRHVKFRLCLCLQ